VAKSVLKLLNGMMVRTTKRVQWHGLDIPKDALAYITSASSKGVVVRFHAKKYGSLELWAKEVRPA
jgi:hypothetical protein